MKLRLLIAVLAGIWLAGTLLLSPSFSFEGPDSCALCHEDIYESWNSSIHARAYENDAFQKAWHAAGDPASCLACHTTGSAETAPNFDYPGVTCESCHGPMSEGHPDEAGMPIPIDSAMCQGCHDKTFKEWQLSKHGEAGIRCFDCHNVHAQGIRGGGSDQLCGSCHHERQTDFAHSTHHTEGLECATCHMPQYATHDTAIEGTGAAGHMLSVGAEVCSRCHEDMVHKSSSLTTLRGKITEMNQEMTVAGVDSVFDLNEEVKGLRWKLARAYQGMWVTAILFFLIGISSGWLLGWFLTRRKKRNGNNPESK